MITESPFEIRSNSNPTVPKDVARMEKTESGWLLNGLSVSRETYQRLAAIARQHTKDMSLSEAIEWLCKEVV